MSPASQKIVAYYRVSTKKQDRSGLGLEAQKAAVEDYLRHNGGTLIGEYKEAESGRRNERPELLKAIAHAKRSKAKLVVAKLDRLARSVAFTSAMMESKVAFICCDNPSANDLTIHIMAAMAEHEAKAISERTIAALAAAKRRGVLLGSARPGHWDGMEAIRIAGLRKARHKASEANRRAFSQSYSDLIADLLEQRDAGKSLQAIADALNELGHTTRRGKPWNRMQVARVLLRAVGQ